VGTETLIFFGGRLVAIMLEIGETSEKGIDGGTFGALGTR
jgi:hypothetical protein